jgi:hypothetical protein
MAKKPEKDLAQSLLQQVKSPYANRCSVGHVLQSVTEQERIALTEALEKVASSLSNKSSLQTGYTARWLSGTLTEFGFKVSDRMIRRHLHGDCSCDS